MKNTISTHYEPPQQEKVLLNKVGRLNNKVFNVIKKANVDTVDDLLAVIGGVIMAEFGVVRASTQRFLGVVEQDVKDVAKTHELPPNPRLAGRMKNQTYIELNSNLVVAEKELMQEFTTAIKPFKQQPTHMADVKTVLQNEFVKNGGVKVTYKNGARMPLTKYFAMATRTARTETQNLVVLDDAKRLGTDYVYLAPCNSPCKTCAALGNRVYCISGKDKAYPSVYGVLFKNGYTCIHPHCRCILRPFFLENHSKQEIQQLQKVSNRNFNLDPRTEQQRQQYQESQAYNHNRWSSQQEYEKAQQVLGKDMPSQLNTLGKYRTGKTKQTPRYLETKQATQALQKIGESHPIQIAKLNNDIYGKLPYNIKNKNVIITREQYERHIAPGANTHDDIYLKVKDKLPKIIASPDYIFKDPKRPNTLLVVGKHENTNVVVRLSVITNKLSNTIITIIPCKEKTLQRMLNNKEILYKK